MKILNVGWVTNILLFMLLSISILLVTNSSDGPMPGMWKVLTFGFLVPYVAAIIANQVRLYAMPDAYFTDGTVSSNFKTKFFWNHGPQLYTVFGVFVFYMFLGGALK